MGDMKIKKAVIREDLLSITKDYRKAILLNQFIYWAERVSDADKFIEKENEIAKNNGEVERELFYGWIYKTAEELADEVMLGLSASQIRRYINDLVDLGYLSKRNNPKYKWDRTLQYRVNLVNIAKDLKKNGFPLSDYKIDIPDDENTNAHPCAINSEPEENQSQSGECAVPEITSENTNRYYSTEITDKYALEDMKRLSSKGNMYASVPEEHKDEPSKKQSRYIPPDYTEEQLRRHIDLIVKDEVWDYHIEWDIKNDESKADSFIDIICLFCRKYKDRFGENHYVMPDKTVKSAVRRYLEPPEEMDGIFDFDSYEQLIDKYFSTDFNKIGKFKDKNGKKKKVVLSFPHFMSDTIRGNLANRLWK